ncbi:F-box protein At3g07870-like [Papaver somniferum]|uniref:F-box protein At3g07870-like n=1 Tax=Papaver somniferum TaxID=3469 RepID=UPI000E704B54|nr:F-box protein At3g07870-like [Papaver somniferum]
MAWFVYGLTMAIENSCLWNPATTEYKEIPKSPNEFPNDNTDLFAFGYAHATGDYKLIKVVFFEDMEENYKEENSLVDVYSLGTNSWKSIQSIPYKFPFPRVAGALVNRALHWLGVKSAKDSSKAIVSVDICEESFQEIELPRVCLENKQDFRTVGVLEGCLCVIAFNGVKSHFDVWVMQDYGVRESWAIRFSIIQERVAGDLLLYGPKHGNTRELRKLTKMNELENYVESLVSLNSGTYLGINKNRRIHRSMKKRPKLNNVGKC